MNKLTPLGFEVALVRVAPVCPSCSYLKTVRAGKNCAGHQRYLCRGCAFRFVREPERRDRSSPPLPKASQLVLPLDPRLVPPPRNQRFSNSELLHMYAYCPHQWIRDRLVEQNIKLVHKIANQAAGKTREPYEDLLQEGICGLLRAIDRFKLDKGCQFSTFATPFISGKISHYLRDRSSAIRMPRTLYELAPREQRIRKELELELERSPTDREVADRMAVGVGYIRDLKEARRNTGLVSLDIPVSDGDGCIRLGDAIASSDQPDEVMQLLGKLEPGDRALFIAVYLEDRPKKHVAREIGRSVHWVNQRLQDGLNLLRETATA